MKNIEPIKYMFITNDIELALYMENLGVQRIFIDLEVNGKAERQKGLDTVKSNHSYEDITKMKTVLKKSDVLVRLNPFNINTKEEIDRAIDCGADILMLPMFRFKKEVEKFIEYVDNRVRVNFLLETPQAMIRAEEYLYLPGIDEVYIGFNDLNIALKTDFMFEFLASGLVDFLTKKLKKRNIPFGFGGVARVKSGLVPGDMIIKEHVRLGSSMVILSRTFIYKADNIKELQEMDKLDSVPDEIRMLRQAEYESYKRTPDEIEKDKNNISELIYQVAEKRRFNKDVR